jgi:hypothetical protein
MKAVVRRYSGWLEFSKQKKLLDPIAEENNLSEEVAQKSTHSMNENSSSCKLENEFG